MTACSLLRTQPLHSRPAGVAGQLVLLAALLACFNVCVCNHVQSWRRLAVPVTCAASWMTCAVGFSVHTSCLTAEAWAKRALPAAVS